MKEEDEPRWATVDRARRRKAEAEESCEYQQAEDSRQLTAERRCVVLKMVLMPESDAKARASASGRHW